MKTIKKKKRQKDEIYKYDDKILQFKLMEKAYILDCDHDGWVVFIIKMKTGKEKIIDYAASEEYFKKDMKDINDKIGRLK